MILFSTKFKLLNSYIKKINVSDLGIHFFGNQRDTNINLIPRIINIFSPCICSSMIIFIHITANSFKADILLNELLNSFQHQLEHNRSQLSTDQLQMLTYLRAQFAHMQAHQPTPSPHANTYPHSRLPQNQTALRHNPNLLDSIGGLNPSLDQLPSDLENVQPTMMHEDSTMLQDLNSLLSSHDIVEDLRISDDDKGSLDHIFSFTSNSLSTFLSNASGQKTTNPADFPSTTASNEDSNSSETSAVLIEKIKLDSSLTNGNKSEVNTTRQREEGVAEPILPMSDDELLASKLNIQMTAEEILKECESYGVNGIQTNSLLRAGRLVPTTGRVAGILKNTKKMFMYGRAPRRAKANEHYETVVKKFKAWVRTGGAQCGPRE